MELLGVAVAIFLVLATIMASFAVNSAQVASIARLGRFHRVAGAGLQSKARFIDGAYFTGKSIAGIALSHSPVASSCSRCG